jgi:hypothetical protein
MTAGPHLTPGGKSERAARDERLARALRENLQRRKAQARARPPADGEAGLSGADLSPKSNVTDHGCASSSPETDANRFPEAK